MCLMNLDKLPHQWMAPFKGKRWDSMQTGKNFSPSTQRLDTPIAPGVYFVDGSLAQPKLVGGP